MVARIFTRCSTLLRALLLTAFFAVGTARAQEPVPTPSDDEVNAIAQNMYCPVCENVPLDVCPTLACQQWREQIRDLLAQGYTEQEVYDYFVRQYGDRVLAAPPARGLNWLVYVAPPVLVLGGIYALYRVLRAWKQPAQQTESAAGKSTPADEYAERLEQELEKRR